MHGSGLQLEPHPLVKLLDLLLVFLQQVVESAHLGTFPLEDRVVVPPEQAGAASRELPGAIADDRQYEDLERRPEKMSQRLVVHHVNQRAQLFSELHRVLRPDGWLALPRTTRPRTGSPRRQLLHRRVGCRTLPARKRHRADLAHAAGRGARQSSVRRLPPRPARHAADRHSC